MDEFSTRRLMKLVNKFYQIKDEEGFTAACRWLNTQRDKDRVIRMIRRENV